MTPESASPSLGGLGAPVDEKDHLAHLAWTIGVEVAGPVADDVDQNSRFPSEALAAMKESRLLAALVPTEFGGLGASVRDVSAAVRALAAHCSASALVLAMHSIEVFNLVRFGTTPDLRAFLEEVGTGQVLLANANSEVGIGGDVGRSACAFEERDGGLVLDKQALAISFGRYADAIITIGRRSPDATETDQLQVVCRADSVELTETSTWDTMGLRGTCSPGFHLVARIPLGLVFPVPFATIANGGAFQARQILLCAVWVGLAEAGLSRAHAYVRAEARKKIGTVPPGAMRVAEMVAGVETARSLLVSCALQFEDLEANGDAQDAGFIVALRNLKVSTSQIAVNTATAALGVCGMAGFKRNTPFSIDRILRDAHGGLIMVNNDRMLRDNAQLLLARKSI
jgi:acyl-CoA dehydrogenase